MSDPNYTAMLLVIDRSVSAMVDRDRTLTVLRALLSQHSPRRTLRTVDIVKFNVRPRYETSFADPLRTPLDFHPRGGRAFRDCLAFALVEFDLKIQELPIHARPSSVEVIVASNRDDDSSIEMSDEGLTRLVERQMLQGWAFANIGDAGVGLVAKAETGIKAQTLRRAS